MEPGSLSGIIPPVITPLLDGNTLDVAGVERLIASFIDAGCSGVFVLGTTGEAPALSYELRREMVRETCRLVGRRFPVLVGISETSVVEALRFGNEAADFGADAIVTTTPYYVRLGQSDLLRHAEMLTSSIPLPLFLYNIPSHTKLEYAPETVRAAADIPGVVGFKDSSGDLMYLRRVIRLLADRPKFRILMGPEELLAQAIAVGAHGGITGGANLFPKLYVALYQASMRNDLKEMRRLERLVLEISERVYTIGDPMTSYLRGMKGAAGALGICSGIPALPMTPFDPEEQRELLEHLAVLKAAVAV